MTTDEAKRAGWLLLAGVLLFAGGYLSGYIRATTGAADYQRDIEILEGQLHESGEALERAENHAVRSYQASQRAAAALERGADSARELASTLANLQTGAIEIDAVFTAIGRDIDALADQLSEGAQ